MGREQAARALVDECAITALLRLAHNATGRRIVATEIRFVNPPPADIQPYRDWFGCPVLFDQPETSIRFPQALLALPLRQPDTVLLNVLERQADDLLAQLPPSDDFEQAVRRCIARLVREGQPELELVANELHVSARTLHRRLAASGVNFRELRESIRLRLAEDYLADPRLQLAEIAQLLGYSNRAHPPAPSGAGAGKRRTPGCNCSVLLPAEIDPQILKIAPRTQYGC